MNTLTIFLMVAVLLMSKINSEPLDRTEYFEFTNETITTESTTPTTTVTTTTVTTTTTTLPPEIDHEWENLVLAGPAVVNYLGLFMLFASRQDAALISPADYTVKYLTDFNSLRSTLLQVSSAMKIAFTLAQDDLVRIRSSMNQIPEHLKAGLILIKSAPDSLLSQLLPYTLRNVDRAANEGSTVSKPALDRFVSVGLLLDELVTLLSSTISATDSTAYLVEANMYADDIKTQWTLLSKLFRKFSERAATTQNSLKDSFIDPINEGQKTNDFNSASKRSDHLNKLIPAAVFIDLSSNLLDMMASTYTDISNDFRVTEVLRVNNSILMGTELASVGSERQFWQDLVSQSVKIARLAQERHNHFVETNPSRQTEYATYLQSASVA